MQQTLLNRNRAEEARNNDAQGAVFVSLSVLRSRIRFDGKSEGTFGTAHRHQGIRLPRLWEGLWLQQNHESSRKPVSRRHCTVIARFRKTERYSLLIFIQFSKLHADRSTFVPFRGERLVVERSSVRPTCQHDTVDIVLTQCSLVQRR